MTEYLQSSTMSTDVSWALWQFWSYCLFSCWCDCVVNRKNSKKWVLAVHRRQLSWPAWLPRTRLVNGLTWAYLTLTF